MSVGGVTPPPVQLEMPWIFEIRAAPGQVGADLLGRLLEGEAGRPGQHGEDVVVVAGRHPVHPALHQLHARVAAGFFVGGGRRHEHQVAVGLGRGLLRELRRVLLGEPVHHLRGVVGLLHGLEQALGRGGVGVLRHVLRAGALHGLHVGGVVGVRRRRGRVVHVVEAVTAVRRDLVCGLGLRRRDVEVDHGGLLHGVGVGRLEVVGRPEPPIVVVPGAGAEDVGGAAGSGGRDLGRHGGDTAGADRLRAAVVEARGAADHGEVRRAGLLGVGVVGARVVAVVEGLDLDLAAADAAGAVHVGGPGLGGLLRALRQPRSDAADTGDVADRDGGGRHAGRGGAAVAAGRGQVPVGAAGAGRRGGRTGGGATRRGCAPRRRRRARVPRGRHAAGRTAGAARGGGRGHRGRGVACRRAGGLRVGGAPRAARGRDGALGQRGVVAAQP